MPRPRAIRGDDGVAEPGDGVVPILLDVGGRRLKVVGLVATAKHVIEELQVPGAPTLMTAFVVPPPSWITPLRPRATGMLD
jgi:hypothetical protein